MNEIEKLKAENERLKRENKIITGMCNSLSNRFNKIYQTLQEIKAIAENAYCLTNYTNKDMANLAKQILQKITKAEKITNE